LAHQGLKVQFLCCNQGLEISPALPRSCVWRSWDLGQGRKQLAQQRVARLN
jgi:hypothetical protein